MRSAICLLCLLLLPQCSPAVADETPSEAKKWEQKYEELLKSRADIRAKVARGDATKEQVIAWMKKGGDKYNRARVEVKDPAEFRKVTEGDVIFSGPQPGEKLPPFKATGLRGERKGLEYDPVAAAGGKPLLLIFQDNSVVGQKGLLLCGKALARIAKKSSTGLQVSTTFLVDDPAPETIFQYDFMDQIDDVIQMSVSRERRDGPGIYGLNRIVAMTILVARDGKVLHNFPSSSRCCISILTCSGPSPTRSASSARRFRAGSTRRENTKGNEHGPAPRTWRT